MIYAKNLNKIVLPFAVALLIGSLLISVGSSTPVQATSRGINGKIVFSSDRDGNSEIYSMNADGTSQTRLTNNAGIDDAPSWSPDGAKIVFTSDRDGNNEIYSMNADGTGQTRLTNNAGYDDLPSWSPDGSKIVFDSDRDGNNEIYSMNADGTGQTRLTNDPGFDAGSGWSPDGTQIVFVSNRDGGPPEIYKMNANGTAQTRLTNNSAGDNYPSWSPDGTQIVFQTNRDGGLLEIYKMNADGSLPTRLTNNSALDSFPSWSPDGSKITFSSERDGNSEIYTMNADGSAQTRQTTNAAYDYLSDWQPTIGTTTNDGNGHTTTTIGSSESYPVLDYTVAANQTLVLDGSVCNVTVSSGGTLKGTGHACTINVNSGGTIAPGHSPGCITSGNLALSGTYAAELGGTSACTGYDQIQVTGTVSVSGILSINLVNGFTAKAGDSFTLITNDGLDPVSGTFTGLGQDAIITIGVSRFKISYAGGDGNDVTLTAQASLPGAPNTGIKNEPLWLSLLLLVAGTSIAALGFGRYYKQRGAQTTRSSH